MDNLTERTELLSDMLEGMIMLEILILKKRGGPDDYDFARVQDESRAELLTVGAETFVGALSNKDRQTRGEALGYLAKVLAVMAFCPGGVTFIGRHYQVISDEKETR